MSIIISVDCWGTLIKSSPLFTEAKIKLIKQYFYISTKEDILKSFSETKKQLNSIIEHTGFQPSEIIIFTLLFSKLNNSYKSFPFLEKFAYEYQQLSIQYPPELYSEETVEYLCKLKELGPLYISSNTLFINGASLKKILQHHKIDNYFDKFYFSDEMHVSKPDKKMFGGSHFHIGDNINTDFVGATVAGSKPIIINSISSTIKDAYDNIAS